MIKLLEATQVIEQLLALQIAALGEQPEATGAKLGQQHLALKLPIAVQHDLVDRQPRASVDVKDQLAVQAVAPLLDAAHLREGVAAGLEELANRALGAPNLFGVHKAGVKKRQLSAQLVDGKLDVPPELHVPLRPLRDVHEHIYTAALRVFFCHPTDDPRLKEPQLTIMLDQRVEPLLEAVGGEFRRSDAEAAHQNRMPGEEFFLGGLVIQGAKPAKTHLADLELLALLDAKDDIDQVFVPQDFAHRDIDLGAEEAEFFEFVAEGPQLGRGLRRILSVGLGLAIDQ